LAVEERGDMPSLGEKKKNRSKFYRPMIKKGGEGYGKGGEVFWGAKEI